MTHKINKIKALVDLLLLGFCLFVWLVWLLVGWLFTLESGGVVCLFVFATLGLPTS